MRERATSSVIDRGGVVLERYAPTYPVRWSPPPRARIAVPPRRAADHPNRRDDASVAAQADAGSQVPQAATPGPILVVDDDRSILATVCDILELEGYPVIAVSDGSEALRRVAEVRPSLVLLDMRMPGLNGWEVARRLRADGVAVPILVMTAAQDAQLWAEQIGADGYLAKPFDLDELLRAVERLWPA